MDKVRVLRVLEYVGSREWVEETLKLSYVPLNGVQRVGKYCCIKSAVIDGFPEIMEKDMDIIVDAMPVEDTDEPEGVWKYNIDFKGRKN